VYLNRAYTWPVEGIERFGDYGGLLLAAFEGELEQQRAYSSGWPSVDEYFKVLGVLGAGGWVMGEGVVLRGFDAAGWCIVEHASA